MCQLFSYIYIKVTLAFISIGPVSLGQVDLDGQAMVLTNLNPVRNWIRREYPRPEINPVSFHIVATRLGAHVLPLHLDIGMASRMLYCTARERPKYQYS